MTMTIRKALKGTALATSLTMATVGFAAMAEAAGETPFLEPAPGRVLAGLARKIASGAKVLNLHEAAALDTLLSETEA